MPRPSRPLAARLAALIDLPGLDVDEPAPEHREPCWPWRGGFTGRGRRQAVATGDKGEGFVNVRRHLYEALHGRPPPPRLAPGCGVDACVNPFHAGRAAPPRRAHPLRAQAEELAEALEARAEDGGRAFDPDYWLGLGYPPEALALAHGLLSARAKAWVRRSQ